MELYTRKTVTAAILKAVSIKNSLLGCDAVCPGLKRNGATLYPEDGCSSSLRKSVNSYQTTRRHIPKTVLFTWKCDKLNKSNTEGY